MNTFRIGNGYDVHKLVPDRKLVLGGIQIEYHCGLLGHSDADVLVHAIMDALLGAVGFGDIGNLFPDSVEEYKDISSLLLLKRVYQKLKQSGYEIINIDSIIVCQEPKLAPYIEKMKKKIAGVLEDCPLSHINIKATTTEGLGFVGRNEAIASYAVALVDQINEALTEKGKLP